MYKQIITILIFLLLTSSTVLTSDISFEGESDWTMFQYNALHTGYNDKDNITVPLQLQWVTRICDGCPFEPITIVGDYILVAHSDSTFILNDTLGLYCLDAETGNENWSHGFSRYLEVSHVDQPMYYNGQVYHMENNGNGSRIAVYDIESSELIKRYTYYAQSNDQLGSIIYKGKLLAPVGTYNGLACMDVVKDSLLWNKRLFQEERWSPSVHNDTVYTWLGGGLQGHNCYTGEQYWYVLPYLGLSDTVAQKLSSSTNSSYLYGLNSTAVIDTLLMVGYLIDKGEMYGVDLRTRKVLWEYNDKVDNYDDSIVVVSPATCDGVVYTFFTNNLVAIEGRTGEILWRAELDTIPEAHPIIANGLVFVSTKYTTYAFDISKQEQVWSYPVGGYITIGNNHLYLSANTGNIYAFEKITTGIEDNISNIIPEEFKLYQNYPNPFNPSTEIEFSLPQKSFVAIDITNIAGQKVRTLTNQQYIVGNHFVTWNGKDDNGNQLSSGIYLYRLVADKITLTKKMILLK